MNSKRWVLVLMGLLLAAIATACFAFGSVTPQDGRSVVMSIHLTSSAFTDSQPIPRQYTCDGADSSPPLQWQGIPTEAQSLVLICDDPDAPRGTWVHWVLYGVTPTMTQLPAAIAPQTSVLFGATQGRNDFKRIGYGGPCPPPGKAHRYFFKLYALDTALNLPPGATKAEVEHGMQGHILAQGQLMGTYQRA